MKTFLLILALIWFVTMTLIGNFAAVSLARRGVTIKGWTLMVDAVVVSFLLACLLGAF